MDEDNEHNHILLTYFVGFQFQQMSFSFVQDSTSTKWHFILLYLIFRVGK
uniref:Uncharacterized protein n=1 Tax=Arundo donax TaxID=35708 RepID=A0A0A8ZFH0_ARUDO